MKNISTAARLGLAAIAAAAVAAPLAASAQTAPSYAVRDTQQQIRGTVVGFNGKYDLQVREANGQLDNVALHQGTIINPTGLPLQNGMRVAIFGYPAGRQFNANEIDAPYPSAVVLGPVAPVSVGLGFGWGWHHWR